MKIIFLVTVDSDFNSNNAVTKIYEIVRELVDYKNELESNS